MRSSLPIANLQESLDAAATVGNVTQKGLAQYPTPPEIARRLAQTLLASIPSPKTVVDPQCHQGNLLEAFPWTAQVYGVELDSEFADRADRIHRLTTNCVRAGEILAELAPSIGEAIFDVAVANYPFGLTWKRGDGSKISAFEWTWQWATSHAKAGYIIGHVNDIEALKSEPIVFKTEQFQWPEANVTVGVAYWDRVHAPLPPSSVSTLQSLWSTTASILADERKKQPPHNIWLDTESKIAGRNHTLRTYLSTRQQLKRQLTDSDVKRLHRIAGETPQTLAVDVETRALLAELIESSAYTLQPAARTAIEQALSEARSVATPIMPVTDFERVAYVDEESHLHCRQSWPPDNPIFHAGQDYRLSSHNYQFTQPITRRRPHYDQKDGTTSIIEHHCELSGQDRFIRVHHESGSLDFRDKPDPQKPTEQVPEHWLWRIFNKPAVPTVADRFPGQHQQLKSTLRTLEIVGGFKYLPGQFDYLSRVLIKQWGLIGAEGGTGKSLFAISAYGVKDAKRCLLVCPRTTVFSKDESAQWFNEIQQFAPHIHVYRLFSKQDYYRLLEEHDGQLPEGFFLTYYEAMGSNQSVESCPGGSESPKWRDEELYRITGQEPPPGASKSCDLVESIGMQNADGIRCIAQPNLVTLAGGWMDMVCLDEAHSIKGLDTQRTGALIRLQPQYRYAFTATPISNTAEDLFSLVGWLCVPGWFKGGRCNASFPYRHEDKEYFLSHFLSTERDRTAEDIAVAAGQKRRKIEKKSPVLSSPARLLKILKPTLAYIDKAQCNPAYRPPQVHDIRVPMGQKQAALYAHYMNIGNVPTNGCKDHRVRRGKQIAYLRSICTDPATAACNHRVEPLTLRCQSNFTPKVVAMLELARDIMAKGEQVVIVNARHGISDELHRRFNEAGIPVSRIDSSPLSGNHSEESNLFKQGHTRVMLMGIKCAVGHSYGNCKHLIIGSLEYAPGPFEQAKWRVDRIHSQDSQIYCILHAGSIEETQFDTVALKDDASKIILKGRRVPRDFKTPDMGEVLAESMIAWDAGHTTIPEAQCEAGWEKLKAELEGTL